MTPTQEQKRRRARLVARLAALSRPKVIQDPDGPVFKNGAYEIPAADLGLIHASAERSQTLELLKDILHQ
jgi:hypothetical protein